MAADPDEALPRVKLKTAAIGLRPWLFQKMVSAPRDLENGALVAIEGRPDSGRQAREGDFSAAREGIVGYGFYNKKSQIAVRVLRWGSEPLGEDYLRRRIRDAIYLRKRVLQLDRITNAFRAVNSEGDELSGLIVDIYNNIASIEIQSYAWYRRLEFVGEILKKELQIERYVVHVDEKVERAEGFRAHDRPADRDAKTEFHERGVRFIADFSVGHKTGAFLDQRDHRDNVARFVKDRDVLDICCYQGGFAIPAATRGQAGRVVAVDLDEKAIEVAKKNAALNNARNIEFTHADGFDYLRTVGASKRRFDVAILDPPKLVHSNAEIARGLSKYTDMNALGMLALRNHGLLFTCSCSGLVSEETFLGILRKAAARAKRKLRILQIGGAAPDHPVSPQFPQGRYLKCVLATVEEAS
ncbi:MAG: class I SAM-dependent rRNA methyltransferase [Planctomycetes bacterium]|nr:class I SAM-dependent rRNA methyltransferase [Planctomycetota bacterium]